MSIFFHNDKLKIYHDEEKRLLNVRYKTPENLSDKEYLSLFEQYLKALEKYAPSFVIIDVRNSQYAIPVEIQEKVSEMVGPLHIKLGTLRLALLTSPEFIVQLSYELIVEEAKVGNLLIAYFTNEKEVFKWFKREKRKKKL